jgi:hypothetical protein
VGVGFWQSAVSHVRHAPVSLSQIGVVPLHPVSLQLLHDPPEQIGAAVPMQSAAWHPRQAPLPGSQIGVAPEQSAGVHCWHVRAAVQTGLPAGHCDDVVHSTQRPSGAQFGVAGFSVAHFDGSAAQPAQTYEVGPHSGVGPEQVVVCQPDAPHARAVVALRHARSPG